MRPRGRNILKEVNPPPGKYRLAAPVILEAFMAVEVEMIERLENLEQMYIKLLNHGHKLLAERVQEEIESIHEQLDDYRYIERFGEYAWNGVSERDFL
jgi:CMP-2-keto-3-deoxyoctulosonic acid synthetase